MRNNKRQKNCQHLYPFSGCTAKFLGLCEVFLSTESTAILLPSVLVMLITSVAAQLQNNNRLYGSNAKSYGWMFLSVPPMIATVLDSASLLFIDWDFPSICERMIVHYLFQSRNPQERKSETFFHQLTQNKCWEVGSNSTALTFFSPWAGKIISGQSSVSGTKRWIEFFCENIRKDFGSENKRQRSKCSKY